jgi:iron complex outermembrane receptor protein
MHRYAGETLNGHDGFSVVPATDNGHLVAAFVNDEIALVPERLSLTLGTQAQYDSDAGSGVQPTARLMWKAPAAQSVWAAVSRALRTPSPIDRGASLLVPPMPTESGLPLLLTVHGRPDAGTERFTDAEVGYRVGFGSKASIDVTGFVGWYDNLRQFQRSQPAFVQRPFPHLAVAAVHTNEMSASTRGVEFTGWWSPVPVWRLQGSVSGFKAYSTGTIGDAVVAEENSTPGAQWQLRSSYSPVSRASLDVGLFHVGAIDAIDIPAYTRADISGEWRFSNRLSARLTGQNLFDRSHQEFGGSNLLVQPTLVPRSVSLRLRWTF